MDDLTISPSAQLTVTRSCETSRLQGQLLARAYQHVFPQSRRSLSDPIIKPSALAPTLSALQQPPQWRQEIDHVAM